jgi:hypothetical protein
MSRKQWRQTWHPLPRTDELGNCFQQIPEWSTRSLFKRAAPGAPDSIHHHGSSQLRNRAHVILRRAALQCPAPRAHGLRLVRVSDLDSEHGKGQVTVTVSDSAVTAVRAARGRPLAIESHWLSPECALALLMHYRDLSVVQWYGPAAAFAGRVVRDRLLLGDARHLCASAATGSALDMNPTASGAELCRHSGE